MFNVCLSQVHNREEDALSCNEQQISDGGAISENRTMWNKTIQDCLLLLLLIIIYLFICYLFI